NISALLVNQGRYITAGTNANLQQSAGSLTVSGSATITGTATITGGLFDLNGGTLSNGLMIVSGAGVLTNGITGATFNGGLSNAGTELLTATTFFNSTVTTTAAAFSLAGAISNNFLASPSATTTLAPVAIPATPRI